MLARLCLDPLLALGLSALVDASDGTNVTATADDDADAAALRCFPLSATDSKGSCREGNKYAMLPLASAIVMAVIKAYCRERW